MFNPQFGAVGQNARVDQGAAVRQAASNMPAIMQLRENRSQFEKEMAQKAEQFDISTGIQKDQFNKTMAFEKKQQRYGEKQNEKASRIGAFGLGVQTLNLGKELNEWDISGGIDSAPATQGGGASPQMKNDWKADYNYRSDESPGPGSTLTTSPANTSVLSQWKSWGLGGASGGMTGAMFAKAAGAKEKWQTGLAGAAGGATLTGMETGGDPASMLIGGLVGGALGYLFG